jgi:hypothetical protein
MGCAPDHTLGATMSQSIYRMRLGSRCAGALLLGAVALAGAWAVVASHRADGGGDAPRRKVDFSPIRGEFQQLRLRRSGFTYKCSECHRSFPTRERYAPRVAEHTEIRLEHGRNDYCMNCHHRTNRNAYAMHDGSEIPADRPDELCGKCHGPHYRDGVNGAHGRRNGYWDSSKGFQSRLLCIQCHDPHNPAFPSLKPFPGPRHNDECAHAEITGETTHD